MPIRRPTSGSKRRRSFDQNPRISPRVQRGSLRRLGSGNLLNENENNNIETFDKKISNTLEFSKSEMQRSIDLRSITSHNSQINIKQPNQINRSKEKDLRSTVENFAITGRYKNKTYIINIH